jgi:hypothetical protein
VRLWGRFSVNEFVTAHPELIAPNHPVESLMRLKVLRATLFDFPAFTVPHARRGQRLRRHPLPDGRRCRRSCLPSDVGVL